MKATTSRYLMLGNTLLATSVFAGTLTFTVLLTVQGASHKVQGLLGFASALFLGAITGVFPIILALQRYADEEQPQGVFYAIVVAGYSIITFFILVAFVLLMIVIQYYTVRPAFDLGILLLAINTSASLAVSLWNLRGEKKQQK